MLSLQAFLEVRALFFVATLCGFSNCVGFGSDRSRSNASGAAQPASFSGGWRDGLRISGKIRTGRQQLFGRVGAGGGLLAGSQAPQWSKIVKKYYRLKRKATTFSARKKRPFPIFVLFCLNIFSAWDNLSYVNPMLPFKQGVVCLGMFYTGTF